jgi:hypothetical protein
MIYPEVCKQAKLNILGFQGFYKIPEKEIRKLEIEPAPGLKQRFSVF